MAEWGLGEGLVLGLQGPLPVVAKLGRCCCLKGVQTTSLRFAGVRDTNLAHWDQPESLKANCLCLDLTSKESDLSGLGSSLGMESVQSFQKILTCHPD